MWSPFYQYYNIRNDRDYPNHLPLKQVTDILEETGALIKKDNVNFYNKDSFPWITIACLNSTNGNYPGQQNTGLVNLIAVVISKNKDNITYMSLLKQIARKLDWEIVLEEDDDENEDVIIS